MNETEANETEILEILARLNREQAIIMIPSTILVIITMLVGVVGNSLTCYVYGLRLKMTPTYFFVVMLAIVDLITDVIITPGRIVQNVVPLMTMWDGFCKNHMALSIFTGLCNCGFLVAIAVDRYRRLCCPHKTQISMKIAIVITICICLLSLIHGSIVTLYYGSVIKPTTYANVFSHSCSAKRAKKVNYYQLGFFVFYLFLTISAIITLVTLYSIVLHILRKKVNTNKKVATLPQSKGDLLHHKVSNAVIQQKLMANPSCTSKDNITTIASCGNTKTMDVTEKKTFPVSSIQPFSSSGLSSGTSPDENKGPLAQKELVTQDTRTQSFKRSEIYIIRVNRTTMTMMMITAVSLLTYIPAISTMIVNATEKTGKTMGTTAAIFYWLARHSFYISSCLNPVIYGYRNRNFVDEVQQLCRKFR